ncbi:antitermination protein [Serratia marcescens]|uniref:antitermination protein Q n=1 Tax=Serratia TaxID=613 RepID=UPI0007452395|nr:MULTISPECIES: antitermination protein [Serratia]MBH2953706.1 antitermination protein [Serratia marcescens]MBN5450637.1 antitermination protein [Serratia marcescens]MDP8704281.1 antitermination protein [Serratia marcescens]ONK18444.1 antitermination protein [Serratia sp. S119]CUY60725.1 Antitermination protein [Serratia marcescens]
MRLESIPKYFAPKSPTFSDSPRATASDSLTGTDVMAAFGMCQAQAEFGLDLFLAKQGISSPERALERLKEYAIKAAGAHKAIRKHSEEIQRRAIGIMVAFAFQDYSRSAASVRTCECCKGEGFIEAEVFSNKTHTPFAAKEFVRASIKMGVEGFKPSEYDVRRELREQVKLLCPTCKGKKVISNACRCNGRGKVLDKKLSDKTGIPVMKDCDKCSGRGYARLPAEQVRKALALEGLEIAETTWRRDYKPFYEQLVTQCHKEESIADSMLAAVTV